MERFLALDVGTKRIGIAVCDPMQIIAQPVKTISRTPESESLDEIKKLCQDYCVKTVVVGLPKNMNGTLGTQAEDAQNFAELVKSNLSVNIAFIDERLTSKEAERTLISQNKKPSKNKGLIDMTSAVLILQQYLDRRR